jgi:hypothetical protein
LELESVFAAFERSLNSTARQLLLHFVELGTRRDVPEAHRARDRNTRLVQLLELDGPTWNTYASSSSRFFAYITDNDVHPAEVQSRHLADWVADEAARDDRYTLAPSSMAQAVSGVRAFLGAAHVRIPAANDDPDVRAQLRAYTKIYSLRGIKPGADKVPLDADIMLTVLERGTELLDNVTTAEGPFDPDTGSLTPSGRLRRTPGTTPSPLHGSVTSSSTSTASRLHGTSSRSRGRTRPSSSSTGPATSWTQSSSSPGTTRTWGGWATLEPTHFSAHGRE